LPIQVAEFVAHKTAPHPELEGRAETAVVAQRPDAGPLDHRRMAQDVLPTCCASVRLMSTVDEDPQLVAAHYNIKHWPR